jgi:hypothetical protein
MRSALTRRQRETLWAGLAGGLLGSVVWTICNAQHFPVKPFNVARLSAAPSILGAMFAGATIVFYAYEYDSPRWRRAVVRWLLLGLGVSIFGLAVGARYTAIHEGEQEIWAAGFGTEPPYCSECEAAGESSSLESCVFYLTEPPNVVACFGRSNVMQTSLLVGASGVGLAVVAAMLGTLLVLTKALERHRILQLDQSTTDRAFQKVVRPKNPFLKVSEFEANLRSLRRRVCRIEFGHAPIGTGFLIGPDLMITNHHVLRQLFAGRIRADVVRCVFDVTREATDGFREVRLAPEWDVFHSPPSDVDRLPDPKGRDPGVNELDFAVVRLTESIGSQLVADEPRGWFYLPEVVHFETGDPLVIAQHPLGRPLEIGLDTDAVVLVNENETRVRYRTNTDNGSSGSPCVDVTLKNLLAIHHSGDPSCRPAYNEGIPIHKIRERLTGAGIPLPERKGAPAG